ncbi:MAG: glycosyltransferase [bacterium]
MRVPRIIHQTLPDKSNLPAEAARNIANLKSVNPGWRHILYDDRDIHEFIQQSYGREMLAVFESINPLYGPARADLFRYLLSYKIGGVYLDIKSGCQNPFDSFVQEEDALLLSRWRNRRGEIFAGWGVHPADGVESEFQNWHIICAPEHPVMLAVIESVLWNLRHYSMQKYGVGKSGVLRTTGPIAYTKAIQPLLHQHACRIFDSEASGLVYSALPLPGKSGHKALFKKHYTRVKRPIVSGNRNRFRHHVQYTILRWLRLIP